MYHECMHYALVLDVVFNMSCRVRRYLAKNSKGEAKCSATVLKMAETADGRTLDGSHIYILSI